MDSAAKLRCSKTAADNAIVKLNGDSKKICAILGLKGIAIRSSTVSPCHSK